METSSARAGLLTWYRGARRDLPWRRTRDPYAIWISEIMLQQTRVDTAIPYFERFMARWPTVEALARSDPEEVRAAWSGLGYYRRASLMLEAAEVINARHGGRLPADPAALAELPGFGPYTVGAVASIAFDRPEPAVDGNVIRVLARLEAITGDPSRGAGLQRVWELARALMPGETPGELSQALMELGALICKPERPRCGECPLAASCRALATDQVAAIPPARRRPKRQRVLLTGIVARTRDGAVLLEKRPPRGLFAGLWSVPFLDGHLTPNAAAEALFEAKGVRLVDARTLGELTHVLTHRDLVVRAVEGRVAKTRRAELSTTPLRSLVELGVPAATTRTLALGLGPDERAFLPGRGRSSRGFAAS